MRAGSGSYRLAEGVPGLVWRCHSPLPTYYMANAETSHRDRQGKSLLLIDTSAGFSPTYTPGDSSLSVMNFNVFLGGVDAANTTVENLEVNYTNNATARVAMVKSIREATTQAVGYVKSNKAWATQFKAVKMAADKLRNIRPPTKTAPPPPPPPGGDPPAEAAKRNKGEQAYVELQAHLSSLITALTACSGYNPPCAAIALNAFHGMLSSFRGLNMFISQLTGQLTTAREGRRKLYYVGDSCLECKFQAVKNAVKGQYGQNSTEYGSVKGIKW